MRLVTLVTLWAGTLMGCGLWASEPYACTRASRADTVGVMLNAEGDTLGFIVQRYCDLP